MRVRTRAWLAALLGAAGIRSTTASAQHHHHHHHAAGAQPQPDEAPPAAAAAAAEPAAPAPPAPPVVVAAPAPSPHAEAPHARPAPAVVVTTTTTTTSPAVAAPAVTDVASVALPRPRPVALDVALGIRAVSRHLSYHQDLGAQFQPYDLWIAPAAALAVAWYPGAHFTRGVLAHIGVYAEGAYVFGVASRDHDGNTYDTVAYDYAGGLRLRVPLPLGRSEVGLEAGYSGQTFATQSSSLTSASTYIPLSTTYSALRGGLWLRLEVTPRIAILASGGYLDVLSAGADVKTYFPRATAAAVDASAGVAIVLGAGFEARALLEARRYFYAMNPNPGDAYIVGGALDQYFSGAAFIAWRH